MKHPAFVPCIYKRKNIYGQDSSVVYQNGDGLKTQPAKLYNSFDYCLFYSIQFQFTKLISDCTAVINLIEVL